MNYEISMNAGGTIAPCSFAKVDTSADEQVLQASATSDVIIGITHEGQKGTPGLAGSDTTVAYKLNDKVPLVGFGNDCLLTAGASGFTAGDLLTTDASGNGTAAARASGKVVGAIALQTVGAAAKGRVLAVCPFTA